MTATASGSALLAMTATSQPRDDIAFDYTAAMHDAADSTPSPTTAVPDWPFVFKGERPAVTIDYAQTNVQLFNQCVALGLPENEQVRWANAMQIVRHAFGGSYRPHGKPFEAHLIGTASVLLHFRANPDIAIAGLLHALYEQGDLSQLPITGEPRQWLAQRVGARAEQLILQHKKMPWRSLNPDQARIPVEKPLAAALMVIRTANYIEELADFSILYCAKRHDSDDAWIDFLQRQMREYGRPEMADTLKLCRERAANFDPPAIFRSQRRASYRLKPSQAETQSAGSEPTDESN